MKNVCFFNSHKTWGGGEKWHAEMALRLRDRGYPVLVITNQNSALFHRLQQEKIPLQQIRISNVSLLNPFKILYICKILQSYKISTIFLNLPSDLKVAGIAAKLARVENIIYRRGIALPVKNSLLNRFLFQHVLTVLIANSEETKRTILQNNPWIIPEEKLKVIYNGVDLHAYDQASVIPVYPRRNNEIVLGNAGRLSKEKGQDMLLNVVKILKDQGLNVRLLIAGEGKLEDELQDTARELGVDQDVLFLGFVKPIKALMENIDIFLLPSLFEGSANVLMEAMTARKPVVAFNVSSNPEIIVHNHTGFLVEQGNIIAFAERVKELAQDENKRKLFGVNARQRVEARFHIQRVVAEIITLIEHDTKL